MNWHTGLLALSLFTLFSCSTPNYNEVSTFLEKSNSIKRTLDSLDRTTYSTYMTTFLDSKSSLYGNKSSNEYLSFIANTTQCYNDILTQLDSLHNHKSFLDTKSTLRALIVFQKEGLQNYYTEILTQEKIDRTLDDRYNEDYQHLQRLFFFNQIQLANNYGVQVADSTLKTLY